MKTLTPLRYPGGKTQIYEYIKELVEVNQCRTYIEPYMGGAGVALKLLINGDVDKIMVNDFDKSIYAFWYSVINYTDELIDMIEQTPITIIEWEKQREIQNQREAIDDLLKLGFSTLFLNRTNRSGILKAGVIGGKKQSGFYKLDCRFNKISLIEKIKVISSYKSQIKLYNMDAVEFIKSSISRTKASLTFFDPPYYVKGSALYTNFYSHQNHVELKDTIKLHMENKKWILTYDLCPEIAELYSDFDSIEYALNYSVANKSKGTEYMFFSKNVNKGTVRELLNMQDLIERDKVYAYRR
ncbi:DNA adenine methylase [Streptococcus caprae]|uniref:site-specific DNA-methyltransferase (adenine-specific) n=1 Tax=Streptococcus caprae TaxID=1640501 RepID=A0ABV8CTQ6_9STRE